MTRILVSCPACAATAELRADEVSLNIHPLIVSLSFYAWACPTCCRFVRKQADAEVVQLLASGGVTARTWPKTSACTDAAPITEDDLLAFGRELEATPDGTSRFDPARTS